MHAGGVSPMMAYTGRVFRKGCLFLANVQGEGAAARKLTFFRLQIYERVGILLVEVYKKAGEIFHLGL